MFRWMLKLALGRIGWKRINQVADFRLQIVDYAKLSFRRNRINYTMKYFIFFLKFVFVLLVSIFIIGIVVLNINENIGFNKTVGWAWDLTSFIIPLTIIYFSTYLTLYLLKIKPNLIFSILSIALLVVCFKFNNLIFILFISSILLFLSNCIYSIYLKFKKK